MKRCPKCDEIDPVRKQWQRVFFAIAACSWMPHWACHYYRLETNSGFIVGSWEFTRLDSVVSLLIYTALIAINLIAIVRVAHRTIAGILSGVLHISIGSLHAYRLIKPFRFEVFGYAWPLNASLREALIVIPFGILCLWMARRK